MAKDAGSVMIASSVDLDRSVHVVDVNLSSVMQSSSIKQFLLFKERACLIVCSLFPVYLRIILLIFVNACNRVCCTITYLEVQKIFIFLKSFKYHVQAKVPHG